MKHIYIFILFFSHTIVFAQNGKIKRADQAYDKFAFIEAREIYLKVVESGYENADILAKLGDSYYFNDELESAFKYYNKLFVANDNANIAPEYYFRYAQSLKSVRRYKEADALITKFKDFKGYDSRAVKYSEEPNYLQLIDFQSGRYKVENERKINSYTVDFGPSYYNAENKVVFATARDTASFKQVTHSWNGESFLQLYTADYNSEATLSNANKFKGKLNSPFHESTPTFTADGNTVYFTRNNYVDGVYRMDVDGINRLKILRSSKINNVWSEPVELPFCSNEYSVAHPALSANGKQLYFASDMPTNTGIKETSRIEKSDIWVVDILENGSFGLPRNLKDINTEGRETFPFVSKNNTLYFSSTGHLGLGGLDIFAATINPDGSISKPVNVGKPVNTIDDDFGFIVNDDTNTGYFSSNRPGGQGDDDIYSFLQIEDLRSTCEILVTGTVVDEKSKLPIAGAKVTVMDANNNKVNEILTQENGKYVFKLECDKQYFVRAEKVDFVADEDLFTTPTKSGFIDVPLELRSSKTPVVDCDDLGPLLDIENIYFNFDKWFIRKDAATELAKIKAFMELYPQTSVDIRSHTDSRAPDDYNDRLSERRAQSTRNWLIKNGIAPNRLTAKGYGERQLINKCSNGVACSARDHQLNRRSEFIVSGLDDYSNCK